MKNEDRGGEVYVRAFPGPGGPWRVSTAGGTFPRWSAITHELLFLPPGGQGKVMAAPYAVVGESFRADTPQIWAPTANQGVSSAIPPSGLNESGKVDPAVNASNAAYDVHPDGKRLAVLAAQDQVAVQDKVVFVSNFTDYLRKIAPGTK